MKLTAEQYIRLCYTIRKNDATDLINLEKEALKHRIKVIQKTVADRMDFDIPFSIINSYNIDSCIVPLNPNADYHHFIDIALFGYFHEFFSTMELDVPNLSVFYYRYLRRDICLSTNDEARAILYKPQAIYTNYHDVEHNGLLNKPTDIEQTKYKLMLQFYFLHEYMHYWIANPVREVVHNLSDIVVETLFEHLKNTDNSNFAELDRPFQKTMYNQYLHEWKNNSSFREEIYCDFQALLCLLELPGIYKREGIKIEVETIFDSVVSFLYIHHIIWLAKNNDNIAKIGDQIAFRINCISTLAWLLENEEYADSLCKILQKGNRFFIPIDLKLKPLYWEKQQEFYAQFTQILMADKEQVINNGSYVFPVFAQPKYEYSPEYLIRKNIPPWHVVR
jgi:hypothetical protein